MTTPISRAAVTVEELLEVINERDRYRDAIANFDTIITLIGPHSVRELCPFCPGEAFHMIKETHPIEHADDCILVEAKAKSGRQTKEEHDG